jgi:hypothetical protein
MKFAAIAAEPRARPQAIIHKLKAGPDFRPNFAEVEGRNRPGASREKFRLKNQENAD